jgi:hypothetical protein
MNSKRKRIIAIVSFIIVVAVILIFFVLVLNDEKESSCNSYSLEECPSECVVCPPCEVCSSLSCRSEEFCESIGFNRNWSEQIMKR